MTRILLAAACLALTTAQASALSCAPNASVAQQFIWAKESPDDFVIVKGSMKVRKLTRTKHKPVNDDGLEEGYSYKARFKGHSLSKDGFKSTFNSPVTVELSCLTGWCGDLPDASQRIYFLQKVGNRYHHHEGACGFTLDDAPTPDNIRVLQHCISGGRCKP